MSSPFTPLRPGAAVAVVAPSSPVREALLEEGLAELRELGFEPVVAADIGARHRFCAGDEERRRLELLRAFADPEIRAVWAARGGYGLTPLLADLDPALLARDPKPVVGESDATALGCWSLAAGVSWIHGPMVASSLRRGGQGYDRSSLLSALGGEVVEVERGRCIRAGSARGTLWGGCLSILAALAGTPWLVPPSGPIVLLLEDVGVKPYQVHRLIVQLRDSGALEGLAAVVLGDFEDCLQHEGQGYTMDEVFSDLFPTLPLTTGWPVGHAEAPHLSLPLGLSAELDIPTAGASSLRAGLPTT